MIKKHCCSEILKQKQSDAENDEEKKKRVEKLIQTQKMELLGQFAGGIVHDFNNMLTVITGYAEMLLFSPNLSHREKTSVQGIQTAAKLSSQLTRQLLSFVRKQSCFPKRLNMNSEIEGIIGVLQRLIGENTELIWLPGQDLWDVFIDPVRFNQILINLCVNARDAIAERGQIYIETRNFIADEVYCTHHLEIPAGEYTVLMVGDNGCGMNKSTVENLFKPFFTTKENKKGTGIGLSVVYEIVKQNEGCLNVYTKNDAGSVFCVYLPKYADSSRDKIVEKTDNSIIRGDETILLVENLSNVLCVAEKMLRHLGYKVLGLTDPEEALLLAKSYTGEIHLLLTDLVMPKMNGVELVSGLCSTRPEIKHLFMSGYSDGTIMMHDKIKKTSIIHKPFSIHELSIKTRQALNNQSERECL